MTSNNKAVEHFKVDEVYARVRKIVSSYFGVDASTIIPESNYIFDLDADSLDPINLQMNFEDEFDIEIPDDCGDAFMTVGPTADYIRGLLKKKKSEDV